MPSNLISFWDIPLLPPLPPVEMTETNQQHTRDWVRDNGKCVRQRTVGQETTKSEGRNSFNHETKSPAGNKVAFSETSAHNVSNQVQMQNSDEYSDESDSEDLSHEDNFSAYNNFLFLRPTCSGRNITINQRFGY